ncbi:hypothetical protein [Micromonospora avicenniae]
MSAATLTTAGTLLTTAGVLLITVVAVAYGGLTLLIHLVAKVS